MADVINRLPGNLLVKAIAGDDVPIPLNFSPRDLTGYTYEAKVIDESTGEVLEALTIDESAAITDHTITCKLSDEQTTRLGSGRFRWYFLWEVGGNKQTIVSGFLELSRR